LRKSFSIWRKERLLRHFVTRNKNPPYKNRVFVPFWQKSIPKTAIASAKPRIDCFGKASQ
jgi:hypothetical protein